MLRKTEIEVRVRGGIVTLGLTYVIGDLFISGTRTFTCRKYDICFY